MAVLLALMSVGQAAITDVIPPKPKQYFNDYAGVVSAQTASRLNAQLAQFDQATSSQVVVAVFPKMPAGTTLEEFAVRTFEQWGIGKRGKDNGVALFVFMTERQMRIEVGYGLEGVLPDALANRIIAEQITPAFRQGQYDAGLTAGVQGILQAVQGEYRQDRAASPQSRGDRDRGISPGFFLLLFLLFFLLPLFRRRGTVYHHRRYPYYGGWGGGWTGGRSWGGGGGFSGGGFSGGGGRSGGGGASGSW